MNKNYMGLPSGRFFIMALSENILKGHGIDVALYEGFEVDIESAFLGKDTIEITLIRGDIRLRISPESVSAERVVMPVNLGQIGNIAGKSEAATAEQLFKSIDSVLEGNEGLWVEDIE